MKKVIIITGASRGIGAAIAYGATAQAYAVCVNYVRDRDAAERVVKAIAMRGGIAVAIQADVAIESEVVQLFEQVDSSLGRVTALVNNAGILALQARVDEMDAARITSGRRAETAPRCATFCPRSGQRRWRITR